MADFDFSGATHSTSEEEMVVRACLSSTTSSSSDADGEYERRRTARRVWVRDRLSRRSSRGSHAFLHGELRTEDANAYRNFIRMDEDTFELLIGMVQEDLKKQDTAFRKAIPVREKVAATLRFLATGESLTSLAYQTRLSVSFLSLAIPEVCKAIYRRLGPIHLKLPSSTAEWEAIAEKFNERWQFPLCLGALDGKHIAFRAKKKDGAFYKNYKGFDSIVLLALVDADRNFIYAGVGVNGRVNDAGVLRRSKLMRIIENAEANFPANATIGNGRTLPYVIIADDAFPLQEHILKPFPYSTQDPKERNFNYRMNRARHCVEAAFGILSSRFRILQTTINMQVEKVDRIVQACCAVHNFLSAHNPRYQEAPMPNVEAGPSNQIAQDEGAGHSNQITQDDGAGPSNVASRPIRQNIRGAQVRNGFSEYFFNEGRR